MTPEAMRKLARTVPANSTPWFDLLNRLGLFQRWLSSDSIDEFRYAAWLVAAAGVWKERSAQIAELLRPALRRGGAFREELLRIFQRQQIHYSREIFDLFLELVHEGAFDNTNYDSWIHLHNIGKENATYTAEVIANFIDRIAELSSKSEATSPFDESVVPHGLQLPENVIDDAANNSPRAFVQHVLPRVVALVKHHGIQT